MFTEITLPDSVTNYLSEAGYPIRVLRGNAGAYSPPNSWRGHARANNAQIETCQNEGVTLVSWAVDRTYRDNFPWQFRPELPARLSLTDRPVPIGMEWVTPAMGHGDEQSFSDPITGATYARVNTNTVWFAFDLEKVPWENVDLDALFGEPLRFVKDRASVMAAREAELAVERERQAELERERRAREQAEAQERAREEFFQAAAEAATGQQSILREQYDQQEDEMRRLERVHSAALAERTRLAVLLNALDNGEGWDRSKAEAEWEQLINHPKVVGIRSGTHRYISGGCTIITTTHLDLHNPNTEESHPLGEFDIYIPRPGTGYMPYFENLTNQRDGRHHPHVSGNGEACFGGSHSMVSQCVQSGEMLGILEVLLQYLEYYNPDDSWGSYASSWGFGGGGDGDGECDCYECREDRGEI